MAKTINSARNPPANMRPQRSCVDFMPAGFYYYAAFLESVSLNSATRSDTSNRRFVTPAGSV